MAAGLRANCDLADVGVDALRYFSFRYISILDPLVQVALYQRITQIIDNQPVDFGRDIEMDFGDTTHRAQKRAGF